MLGMPKGKVLHESEISLESPINYRRMHFGRVEELCNRVKWIMEYSANSKMIKNFKQNPEVHDNCILILLLFFHYVKCWFYRGFLLRNQDWLKTQNAWVKEFIYLCGENRISWIFGLIFENAHEWKLHKWNPQEPRTRCKSNRSKQTTTIGICHQKFHNCNNTSLQIPTTNKVLKEEATCHPWNWGAFEKCVKTQLFL